MRKFLIALAAVGGVCLFMGYLPVHADSSTCLPDEMACSIPEMITPIQLKYPDLASISLPSKSLKQAVICFYLPDGTKLFEKRLNQDAPGAMTLADILHHFKGQFFKTHYYYCCVVREENFSGDAKSSLARNRMHASTFGKHPPGLK